MFAGALNRQPNVKHIHAEKTHIENVFFPQEAIPSKLTCEKIHAPYWSITYNTIQCMSNLL